jgi:hypothetical protein
MKTNLTLIILSLFVVQLTVVTCKAQNNLWATATGGGTWGDGTILEGDSNGTNFRPVATFDSLNGTFPVGNMVIVNNKLYGITMFGTFDNSCCIFCYDPAVDTIAVAYQFAIQAQNGNNPAAGLITASDGKLYGTTIQTGHYSDSGVIFSFDPLSNYYSEVYNFNGYTGAGTTSELLQANNGKLYAIAQYGGPGNSALLYGFDISNSQYDTLHTFTGNNYDTISALNLYTPTPPLIQASDNKLYGIFSLLKAGTGFLFSYDISNGTFTNLHNFGNTDGFPQGGLVQAGDGKIYGTTATEIFSFDTGGGAFAPVFSFTDTTGHSPLGKLNTFGNSALIGTTSTGGNNGLGTIFTFDFTSHAFNILLNLTGAGTGGMPECPIIGAGTQTPTHTVPVTAAHIDVYPNPASNLIYITGALPGTPYALTNVSGQQIAKGVLSGPEQQVIDVSQLAAGTYFLNNWKFIKQ